jgi:hypothetical protein
MLRTFFSGMQVWLGRKLPKKRKREVVFPEPAQERDRISM